MRKGFTLVEILAVFVILGLLLLIAVPEISKFSKNNNIKAYESKISMFESAIELVGDKYKAAINNSSRCIEEVNGEITFKSSNCSSDAPKAILKNISSLISEGTITKDETCEPKNTSNSENIILNPVNDKVINNCEFIIYEKNNRIFAKFDKTKCDNTSSIVYSNYCRD